MISFRDGFTQRRGNAQQQAQAQQSISARPQLNTNLGATLAAGALGSNMPQRRGFGPPPQDFFESLLLSRLQQPQAPSWLGSQGFGMNPGLGMFSSIMPMRQPQIIPQPQVGFQNNPVAAMLLQGAFSRGFPSAFPSLSLIHI